jgi:hypothetical protein
LNARTGFDPLDGIEFYWRSFADGFSATPSIAWLTAALFVAGLWHVRRFPPGGRAVFALALVGIAGVVIHPQHQGRFLTSWIFAAWIGAGAGGAVLLEYLLPRQLWLPVAGAATIMLAVSSWRAAPPAAYTVAIHPTGERPSDLDLIRTVLPDVAGLRSFSYATTFGESALWSWVPQEACRCKVDVERPWIAAASREEARSLMADRLASSQSPIFVIVDAPAWPDQLPEFGLAYDSMSAILDATAAQDRYVREKAYRLPQFAAEISVWRRRASPPHGRPSAVETQPALSEAGWGAAGGAAPVHVDKPYHQAGS